jgi:hypothetical protein
MSDEWPMTMSNSETDESPILYGIGESLPDVPLQPRHPSKKMKNMFYILLVLTQTIVILVLISRPTPCKSCPVIDPLTLIDVCNSTLPPTLPIAVIDVHTSAASFPRLTSLYADYFSRSPFLRNGTIVLRAVLSASARVAAGDITVVRVKCSDEHVKLPCRVDASYPAFLSDFPNCAWHFRAEDDTFVNLTGLYHYILRLNSQYHPRTHIVFRAHANPERLKNWYIHGGSGWIASRAFVEAHVGLGLSLEKLLPWSRYHQHDTAESIVVRHIYVHAVLWDEWGIQGFACANCGESGVRRAKWDSLGACPDGAAVRVNQIWAMHTASLQGLAMRLLQVMSGAPDEVLLVRENVQQRARICKKQPKNTVWDAARRALAYVALEDLPNPLINYGTLQNDNVG